MSLVLFVSFSMAKRHFRWLIFSRNVSPSYDHTTSLDGWKRRHGSIRRSSVDPKSDYITHLCAR